jgi:hypothetical protein
MADAMKMGLDKGIIASWTEGAPRDNVAQYALNALLTGETVIETRTQWMMALVPGGLLTATGVPPNPNAATAIQQLAGSLHDSTTAARTAARNVTLGGVADAALGTDYTLTQVTQEISTIKGSLAETVFGLKKDMYTDAFGRPQYEWRVNGKSIGVDIAVAPSFVYTDRKSADNIKDALEDKDFEIGSGVMAVINGRKNTMATTTNAQIAALTGNGVVVELFVNDGKVNAIAVTHTILTSFSINAAGDEITLKIESNTKDLPTLASPTSAVEDFKIGEKHDLFAKLKDLKKDALVLAIPLWDTDKFKVLSAADEVTKKVEGTITRSNAAQNVFTIGGTAYGTSFARSSAANGLGHGNVGADWILYLDKYDFIVDAEEVEGPPAPPNFVFVTRAYQSLVNGELASMIEGTLPNGDKVEAVRTSTSVAAGTLYRVNSVNSAGAWALTAISTSTSLGAVAGTGVGQLGHANGAAFGIEGTIATGAIRILSSNNTSITTLSPLFASNVNFFYYSGNSITHTATGVQNVPSVPTNSFAVVEGGNAPRVVAVFIAGSPVITDPSAIAYIASGTSLGANMTVSGESAARRTLNVYLNGVRTEVPVSHTAIGTGDGELNLSGGANTFFTFTQNQNGVYSFTPVVSQTGTTGTMTHRKSVTISSAANRVEANRWASFDGFTDLDISNATFVNLRSNNNPSTSDAAAFSSVANRTDGTTFTISYIFNTNTKVVSVIFIEAVTVPS